MEDGVHRAGKNKMYFTLGMRGAGDGRLNGDDPIAITNDVIETQPDMLTKYYGDISTMNHVSPPNDSLRMVLILIVELYMVGRLAGLSGLDWK